MQTLRRGWTVALLLAHGQAVCGATPSPMQNGVPRLVGPVTVTGRSSQLPWNWPL